MQEAASTIVQVVTAGPDWAGIAAAIAGGLVGLAGIGATIWSITKRINAENERARLAEKRQVYASYITAFDSFVTTAKEYSVNEGESRGAARAAFMKSSNALGELYLIAPRRIRDLADKTLKSAGEYKDTKELLYPLLVAMRADLGEPDDIAEPDDIVEPATDGGPTEEGKEPGQAK